jgi:hypothetical protein
LSFGFEFGVVKKKSGFKLNLKESGFFLAEEKIEKIWLKMVGW